MNLKNLNTDNMKKIAVLLTAFNRREKTLRCLDRLYSQIPVENVFVDVYLTNDGCTDGTPEAVKEQFPKVHIINGDGKLFWNRGMWTAWNAASANEDYDYYMWLNDDTFFYKDAVLSLVNAAEQTNNQAIIIGATVDSLTRQMLTYGGRLKGNGIAPVNGKLTEVDYFNGNIVLVSTSVYHVLGNLDYYYTHSKGDFDYGLRAKKAGIKMYQVGIALGECDAHEYIDKWCDPQVPLRQRWKAMMRPNGMPPREIFHLEKQTNILKAILHYFTIILRCFLPSLWVRSGKIK